MPPVNTLISEPSLREIFSGNCLIPSPHLTSDPCAQRIPLSSLQGIPRLAAPTWEQSPVWIFSWSIPAAFPAGILLRNPWATSLIINSSHRYPVLVPKDFVMPYLAGVWFQLCSYCSCCFPFPRNSIDGVTAFSTSSRIPSLAFGCWKNIKTWAPQGFTIRNYIPGFAHFQILSLPNKALGIQGIQKWMC